MKNYRVKDNLVFENARIIYRNFAGKESQNNREGERNFCVVVDDPEKAQALAADGWNVRIHQPHNEDDPAFYFIPVRVSFKNIPPKIFMISGKVKTLLTEKTVGNLDYAEIKNVDLVLRPYNWEVNGKTGVKAYLKDMYVTIYDDPFSQKYADLDGIDEDYPF